MNPRHRQPPFPATQRAAAVLFLMLGVVAMAWASPVATVRITVDAVLSALAEPDLEDAARCQQVLELIGRQFDFRVMTQRTLATNWDKADPRQQARLVSLFRELLINTYWQRLAAYRGERVDVSSEEITDGAFATVRTIIHARTEIPVDYKLVLTDGQWLAYDVVIEQISLVRHYRGAFLDEVHRGGIEGLLRALEARVAESMTPAAQG